MNDNFVRIEEDLDKTEFNKFVSCIAWFFLILFILVVIIILLSDS